MMKFIYLLIVTIFLSNNIFAQEVGISPRFFTTEKTRLSIDLGLDMSWAGKDGKSSLMTLNGDTTEDNIKFNKIPNVTANFGFDIYSPLSKLGFYIGVSYNKQKYTIKNDFNQVLDSISNTNIEIPAYLKLRFGKLKSKGHLWVALGGGYSIPTKTKRSSYSNGQLISQSEDNELFKSVPFLSSIIGYEFMIPFSGSKGLDMYDRDNFRVLLYAKGNYDLGNRINPNFNFPNNTSVSQINNPDIQFLRISFGIKVLMRISKLKEVIDESLKKY